MITILKERYTKNIIEIIVDYDYTTIDLDVKKRKYLLDCGYTQTLINIKQTIFNSEIEITSILNNIITKLENNNIT